MKNECNIVRDLLPLYIENMASEETRAFVEAHLSNCPECNELYLLMTEKGEEEIADQEAQKKILPLRLVKRMLWKKLVFSIVAAVLSIALFIGSGTLAYNIIDKQNKNAEIDYGESQWYSLEDRKLAIDMIFNQYINRMDFGYDIKSVRFAGDDECYSEWKEWNENPNHNTKLDDYRDFMVIYISMKTPSWAKNKVYLPNIYYEDIKLVLIKDKDYDEYWSGWHISLLSVPDPYSSACVTSAE